MRRAFASVGGIALAASAAAAAPPAVCRVEAFVEPVRAVVGEQVLYRARVERRDEVVSVEWTHPPAFASFRTERLPSDPRPDRARDGPLYRVRDEVRALFADRTGRFTLEAPDLLCHLDGSDRVSVSVPDVQLTVVPFPEEGRPEDFAGLVGPLSLIATVTPREVALGDTVRVALRVRGTGNVWDLPPPFSARDFAPAEVFARRPERVLDRGRSLFVRQHFVYDVVPREAGALRVPGLAIPYFDPDEDRYRTARTEAVVVRVTPRPGAPADHSVAPPDEGVPAEEPAQDPGSGRGWMIALGALALALAAVLGGRRLGRRGPGDHARALARSARALEDPDARAAGLDRALRAALSPALPDAATASPDVLRDRVEGAPALREAVRLLGALERARFDPAAGAPDPDTVIRAIDALRADRGRGGDAR